MSSRVLPMRYFSPGIRLTLPMFVKVHIMNKKNICAYIYMPIRGHWVVSWLTVIAYSFVFWTQPRELKCNDVISDGFAWLQIGSECICDDEIDFIKAAPSDEAKGEGSQSFITCGKLVMRCWHEENWEPPIYASKLSKNKIQCRPKEEGIGPYL